MLVGIGDDARAYVWNRALGIRGELLAAGDEFESLAGVAISGDDSRIATINDGGDRARLWRPPNSNLVVERTGVGIAVADRIAVTTEGREMIVLDLATGKVVKQFSIRHAPTKRSDGLVDLDREHLLVTADGSRALTYARTGAAIYDLSTGRMIRDIIHDESNDGDLTTWSLSSHGTYAIEFGDQRLLVHELATGKVVVSAPSDGVGRHGDASPDESKLVVADATPAAWQLPSGTPLTMPPLALPVTKISHPGTGDITLTPGVSDLVFSPLGDRIVVLGLSAPMVIDAAGKLVARLELSSLATDVITVRFSGDGKRLVTQVQDLAAAWNTDTGEALFTIPDTAPRAVAITADGARIATGSNDGTIRIWDDTGRMLEQIHAHRAAISALAISKDGTRLIAQSDDDETTIWDIHLEQRSPDAIAKIAAEATPWHVVGGTLVLRKPK
jgi:WD40 repeat protein